MVSRRRFLGTAGALLVAAPLRAGAAGPEAVIHDWYRLVLELVRHTATYSPPVAARAFGWLGAVLWEAEALAAGGASLAGQIPGLAAHRLAAPRAPREAVLAGALGAAVPALFGNTGPTGQRAMAAMARRHPVSGPGGAAGRAVAARLLAHAATDGGARIETLGFPAAWTGGGPGRWAPTSAIGLQQTPLLPRWGEVRPFAMPAAGCPLPPPPAYSTDPASAFFAEAREVWEVSRALDDDSRAIARFWSDDPMLSATPPGHWIAIALQLAAREAMGARALAALLARLGMAQHDAFVACWQEKYHYNLIRPVTFIRAQIDPDWEPLLITPPFPEYPSGHSTLSGASAAVLSGVFGAACAFEDHSHEDDGLAPRSFVSFAAAAQEAALSRLYGGIHFRAAIEAGLRQGACVAEHAARLVLA